MIEKHAHAAYSANTMQFSLTNLFTAFTENIRANSKDQRKLLKYVSVGKTVQTSTQPSTHLPLTKRQDCVSWNAQILTISVDELGAPSFPPSRTNTWMRTFFPNHPSLSTTT